MKIAVIGSGKGLTAKKVIELASKIYLNSCNDCNYTFNKNYEKKCPLCGCEVKI